MANTFQKKHEELLKKENDLKENLQNEVTKTKEKLELFLTDTNNEVLQSERINKGIKKIENEKNTIKVLSYISKINKTKNNIKKLLITLMKNIKFSFDENTSNIKYEEYYFNGICIPKNIEFKDITISSFNISWIIDKINIENIDYNKIKYIIEMKRDQEKFKKVYEGSDSNYSINNLSKDSNYELRVCSIYEDLIGSWSEIKKINILKYFNVSFKDNLKPKHLNLCGGGKITDEFIRIEKNGNQYGPYKNYPKGKYLIIYYGENLLYASFDIIENGIKEPFIPFNILYKSNNEFIYNIIIPDELKSGIEFRAHNNKNPCFIIVKNIEVYKYNE